MIVLQMILFCALFTLMVKIGVGNNALNGLYFYPKPVQEKVYELGLTDRETVAKKRKRFMIAFFAVMAAALILIIRVWNGIQSFWPNLKTFRRTLPLKHSGIVRGKHLLCMSGSIILNRSRRPECRSGTAQRSRI